MNISHIVEDIPALTEEHAVQALDRAAYRISEELGFGYTIWFGSGIEQNFRQPDGQEGWVRVRTGKRYPVDPAMTLTVSRKGKNPIHVTLSIDETEDGKYGFSSLGVMNAGINSGIGEMVVERYRAAAKEESIMLESLRIYRKEG